MFYLSKPEMSDRNRKRLNRAMCCLGGCMAKDKVHNFDPSVYPYRLELNGLHYKISTIKADQEVQICNKTIFMSDDTNVSLYFSDHGVSFVFLLWFKENGSNVNSSLPTIQSMFVIHLGQVCGLMTPISPAMIGWGTHYRRPLLEFLSTIVRRLCIKDPLSENTRLFRILDRRWARIKLLLLARGDPNATCGHLPLEILRHIIAFLPKWDEIDWKENVNGPKGGPVLRKRKAVCYTQPSKKLFLDKVATKRK